VIRVAVVDDQALVRMGLRTLLETEDGLELVAEAADGNEGLAVVRRSVPDVVLMDIRMPVLDGLAALREITADAALKDVRVIMLTTFELDEYVFEALRAGASGFVLKDADPEDLVRAVRVVAEGGSLLSPSVTRRVIEQFAGKGPERSAAHPQLNRLTERERGDRRVGRHRPFERRDRHGAGGESRNRANARQQGDDQARRQGPRTASGLRGAVRANSITVGGDTRLGLAGACKARGLTLRMSTGSHPQ
jgi:DNA-binding NarL/FixJ family response regulator